MNIKSDATTDFTIKEESKKATEERMPPKNNFIWFIILLFGGALMWAALLAPEVRGIIAFFVFFIGLNRVDAAINYFRGIDGNESVSDKDIL